EVSYVCSEGGASKDEKGATPVVNLQIHKYKLFFKNAVKAVLVALPRDSVSIFYQTDTKPDFCTHISKASLIAEAIEDLRKTAGNLLGELIEDAHVDVDKDGKSPACIADLEALLDIHIAWHKLVADSFENSLPSVVERLEAWVYSCHMCEKR
ncbi:unnamed protein product, partial [Amoebophrya sp. A25]